MSTTIPLNDFKQVPRQFLFCPGDRYLVVHNRGLLLFSEYVFLYVKQKKKSNNDIAVIKIFKRKI